MRLVGDFLTPAALPLRALEHTFESLGEKSGSEVVRFDSFSSWADALWTQLAPDLGTCAVRDAAYLNWRFCTGPYSYRRFALQHGGEPIGFAVTTIHESRVGKLAYLMEFMVPKGETVRARQLLAHACLDAAREGATGMFAVATRRQPHRRAMLQSGFLPAIGPMRRKFTFGTRRNGSGVVPNRLFHIDDWYLSAADFDTL